MEEKPELEKASLTQEWAYFLQQFWAKSPYWRNDHTDSLVHALVVPSDKPSCSR